MALAGAADLLDSSPYDIQEALFAEAQAVSSAADYDVDLTFSQPMDWLAEGELVLFDVYGMKS